MRLLVYTCVFASYDRVFPPVCMNPDVDYVIITDDYTLRVDGWRTVVPDMRPFHTAKAPNRYFKMLGQHLVTGYDASVYVDGNVRVIGAPFPLVRAFLQTGTALGVYPHPLRHSVAEEVTACLLAGKVMDADSLRAEYAEYVADGFPDTGGLVESTILLKNHAHPALEPAMRMWWALFERFDSRDQISLPYVLWKSGLPCDWQPRSFRENNPFFGIYPHVAAKGVPAMYTYLSARSYDNWLHRWCLKAWHAKWWLQRRLRRRRISL